MTDCDRIIQYCDKSGNMYVVCTAPSITNSVAIMWSNGDKTYFKNGKLHRLDGPAVELVDGSNEWWIENIKYTKEEFNQKIRS